jgi:hypothetical protein
VTASREKKWRSALKKLSKYNCVFLIGTFFTYFLLQQENIKLFRKTETPSTIAEIVKRFIAKSNVGYHIFIP